MPAFQPARGRRSKRATARASGGLRKGKASKQTPEGRQGRGVGGGKSELAFLMAAVYPAERGHVLRKEGTPMKHFLRDVLAAFVAAVLAALVVRFMNL